MIDADPLAIVLDVDRWDRATDEQHARALADIARLLGPAFAPRPPAWCAGHQRRVRSEECPACHGLGGTQPQSGSEWPDCETCGNTHVLEHPYVVAPLGHRVAQFAHALADFVLVPGRLDIPAFLLARTPLADDAPPPPAPLREMTASERRHACLRGGSFDRAFEAGTWPEDHPFGLVAAERPRRAAVDIPGLVAAQHAAFHALATEVGPLDPHVPPGCLVRTGHGTADPQGGLEAVAFSRDGRWLATGGAGEVRVWDAATGRQLSRLALAHPRHAVASLAFSPDHLRIVVATIPDVEVFEIATGEPLQRLGAGLPASRMGAHYKQYRAATWLPDGRILVAEVTDADKRAFLWLADPETGEPGPATEWTYTDFLWGRMTLATTFAGTRAALSVPDAGAIAVWDLARWQVVARVPVDKPPSTIALGPDHLFTAARDQVFVHPLSTGQAPRKLGSYALSVLAASPDGTRIAWQSTGIGITDRETGDRVVVAPATWIPIAFSPDGTRLATAVDRHAFAAIWPVAGVPSGR